MASLLISVVIPAYNEEKYIKTCLESVVKQQFQEINLKLLSWIITRLTRQKSCQKHFPSINI